MHATIISLFFLAASTLVAQDFLITTKGDTLKGNITFQLNGKVESATVKGTKRETISAINTRIAFQKGKQFKPVQFNGTVQFMEILADGYLSLLAFQQPNAMSYDGRLLQKRDGKTMEVPGIGFKKQMTNYLSDSPTIVAQIQDGQLGLKELPQIIEKYNSLISGKTETQKEQANIESGKKSKLELLTILRSDIEQSNLFLKQDALDILADWSDKIKSGKPIAPYLSKALRSALGESVDLIKKLDELIKP
jgi:hypothetical protein